MKNMNATGFAPTWGPHENRAAPAFLRTGGQTGRATWIQGILPRRLRAFQAARRVKFRSVFARPSGLYPQAAMAAEPAAELDHSDVLGRVALPPQADSRSVDRLLHP